MRPFARLEFVHARAPALPTAAWRIFGRATALAAVDEGRRPRTEAVAPGMLCPCVAERPVLAPISDRVTTDVKNALLDVHLGFDDARPPCRQDPARQSMQLSRDRDHD